MIWRRMLPSTRSCKAPDRGFLFLAAAGFPLPLDSHATMLGMRAVESANVRLRLFQQYHEHMIKQGRPPGFFSVTTAELYALRSVANFNPIDSIDRFMGVRLSACDHDLLSRYEVSEQ